MAKRKTRSKKARKSVRGRRRSAGRKRSSARKTARRPARKTARRPARKATRRPAKKAARKSRSSGRKRLARKPAPLPVVAIPDVLPHTAAPAITEGVPVRPEEEPPKIS
jgi:hypothetical protein